MLPIMVKEPVIQELSRHERGSQWIRHLRVLCRSLKEFFYLTG